MSKHESEEKAMVKQTNQKRNIPIRLAALLLCLTMISLYLVSGLFAKYTTESDSSDSARVAAFVFDVNDEANHFIDVSTVNAPGKQAVFQFSITNENGFVVSEVAEQYKISVAVHGSLPFVVTISDATDAEVITLNSPISDQGSSGVMAFQAGQTGTHVYTLTVSWPESEKDLCYANAGLSEIELRISAWQVD